MSDDRLVSSVVIDNKVVETRVNESGNLTTTTPKIQPYGVITDRAARSSRSVNQIEQDIKEGMLRQKIETAEAEKLALEKQRAADIRQEELRKKEEQEKLSKIEKEELNLLDNPARSQQRAALYNQISQDRAYKEVKERLKSNDIPIQQSLLNKAGGIENVKELVVKRAEVLPLESALPNSQFISVAPRDMSVRAGFTTGIRVNNVRNYSPSLFEFAMGANKVSMLPDRMSIDPNKSRGISFAPLNTTKSMTFTKLDESNVSYVTKDNLIPEVKRSNPLTDNYLVNSFKESVVYTKPKDFVENKLEPFVKQKIEESGVFTGDIEKQRVNRQGFISNQTIERERVIGKSLEDLNITKGNKDILGNVTASAISTVLDLPRQITTDFAAGGEAILQGKEYEQLARPAVYGLAGVGMAITAPAYSSTAVIGSTGIQAGKLLTAASYAGILGYTVATNYKTRVSNGREVTYFDKASFAGDISKVTTTLVGAKVVFNVANPLAKNTLNVIGKTESGINKFGTYVKQESGRIKSNIRNVKNMEAGVTVYDLETGVTTFTKPKLSFKQKVNKILFGGRDIQQKLPLTQFDINARPGEMVDIEIASNNKPSKFKKTVKDLLGNKGKKVFDEVKSIFKDKTTRQTTLLEGKPATKVVGKVVNTKVEDTTKLKKIQYKITFENVEGDEVILYGGDKSIVDISKSTIGGINRPSKFEGSVKTATTNFPKVVGKEIKYNPFKPQGVSDLIKTKIGEFKTGVNKFIFNIRNPKQPNYVEKKTLNEFSKDTISIGEYTKQEVVKKVVKKSGKILQGSEFDYLKEQKKAPVGNGINKPVSKSEPSNKKEVRVLSGGGVFQEQVTRSSTTNGQEFDYGVVLTNEKMSTPKLINSNNINVGNSLSVNPLTQSLTFNNVEPTKINNKNINIPDRETNFNVGLNIDNSRIVNSVIPINKDTSRIKQDKSYITKNIKDINDKLKNKSILSNTNILDNISLSNNLNDVAQTQPLIQDVIQVQNQIQIQDQKVIEEPPENIKQVNIFNNPGRPRPNPSIVGAPLLPGSSKQKVVKGKNIKIKKRSLNTSKNRLFPSATPFQVVKSKILFGSATQPTNTKEVNERYVKELSRESLLLSFPTQELLTSRRKVYNNKTTKNVKRKIL